MGALQQQAQTSGKMAPMTEVSKHETYQAQVPIADCIGSSASASWDRLQLQSQTWQCSMMNSTLDCSCLCVLAMPDHPPCFPSWSIQCLPACVQDLRPIRCQKCSVS